MPTIITYAVLVAALAGAFIHTLLTDPAAAGLLSPALKTGLALVAVLIAAFLRSAPQALADHRRMRRVKAGLAGTTVLSLLLACSCVHVPTPDGGSVSVTDAGHIETCIDWARQNCAACRVDGGAIPQFVDAGAGK